MTDEFAGLGWPCVCDRAVPVARGPSRTPSGPQGGRLAATPPGAPRQAAATWARLFKVELPEGGRRAARSCPRRPAAPPGPRRQPSLLVLTRRNRQALWSTTGPPTAWPMRAAAPGAESPSPDGGRPRASGGPLPRASRGRAPRDRRQPEPVRLDGPWATSQLPTWSACAGGPRNPRRRPLVRPSAPRRPGLPGPASWSPLRPCWP